MKKCNILWLFLTLIFCINNSYAQFTGGNGDGYASSQSNTVQLLPPLYNDLNLTAITNPANNEVLEVNTPYNLSFSLSNEGIYPVMPNDSVFFTVMFDNVLIADSFFFLSDTLQIINTVEKTFANFLSFTDSSDFVQLCVSISGTSFAADSVSTNNTICNTIKINDPSGISFVEDEMFNVYFNSEFKCIYVKNLYVIKKIELLDVLGRNIPFIASNPNSEELYLTLTHNFPRIIFVKIEMGNKVFSKRLLVY